MIESLRIENLAIIDEAELEFGAGLNVLTGETGAGKSVVLGALALLVGGRASAGSLREGADEGSVEAVFRTDSLPDLEAELAARGLAFENALRTSPAGEHEVHELVVCRSIARSGRSRARVGGELLPVSSLAELLSGRVEISSQHSSQALLRPESHGRFLDAAGGLLPLREEVAGHYEAIRRLDRELDNSREQAEERARRQDFLAFQVAEIDEVGLVAGELEELASEHARLAHADSLRADAAAAARALVGDDSDAGLEANAGDRVAAGVRGLEAMARLDEGVAGLLERLRGVEVELRDVARELERYADAIDADPARLARVEERLQQVERLRRKYGSTADEILAFRERAAAELAAIEGADSRVGQMLAERRARVAQLTASAQKLSTGRAAAAGALAGRVERGLRELAMPAARFEVALEPAAILASLPEGLSSGPAGAEAPEFRFSANAGERPLSLQKVASGGELSRLFLAVKNALRGASANMVLVFDEVDAGIGGRAAERVGRILAELASEHQVLCITHLPQIAAFADVHFKVEKSERKGRTRVAIRRIEGEARVDEIARMAGGEQVGEATREHARELLRARSLG